jgi:hypothetical protein
MTRSDFRDGLYSLLNDSITVISSDGALNKLLATNSSIITVVDNTTKSLANIVEVANKTQDSDLARVLHSEANNLAKDIVRLMTLYNRQLTLITHKYNVLHYANSSDVNELENEISYCVTDLEKAKEIHRRYTAKTRATLEQLFKIVYKGRGSDDCELKQSIAEVIASLHANITD